MNPSFARPTRRRFLGTSLAGAAALSVPIRAWGAPQGANGDVRVAVIGIRSKGAGHIGSALSTKGCRLAAICDADAEVLAKRKADCDNKGAKVETYSDYRKLLENPEIDAVVIATPNHLHSLIAIAAAQAGKHVYVEKPVSHNVWEGRQLAEASRAYDVVIQHGMQRRSDVGWREIMEWIKDEPLGKMVCSRGLCYKARESIGKVDGPREVPESVDYNLWSGPREELPLMRQQFHYDWHWQWAYGNGDIGNQGPHQLDVARWVLGDPALPPGVLSVGGRFGYEDDGQTANTQIAFFDYKPVPLIFEVRGLPEEKLNWKRGMPSYKGARVGNVVEFEGGYVSESKAFDNDGKEVRKFGVRDGDGHFEGWIAALHGGPEAKDQNLSATTGHLSAGLAHLANISYRVGQDAKPGEIKERLDGDKLGLETYERFAEHLEKNGIDPAKTKPTLGATMTFDPETEQFTGSMAEEGNALLTEDYREEFAIPKIG